MQWQINYSRTANNYALDSYPYNEEVLVAIESLGAMPHPFPPGISVFPGPIYVWEVANHQVYYEVTEETLTINIIAIKPL